LATISKIKLLFLDQSNRIGRRKRRSTRDVDITSLDFEIVDRSVLPTVIEEATLNVFLTNSNDYSSSNYIAPASDIDTSESEFDDDSSSSSSDISPKKIILKSNRQKSHHTPHLRHHTNRIQIEKNSQAHTLRLQLYSFDVQDGRQFLFSKDVTLPDNINMKYNKWIQLDLTSIVRTWLEENDKVLSIDIYCEMCSKYGISIINDASHSSNNHNNNPALNVIGAIVRTKRKTPNHHRKNGKEANKENKMKKTHCRHNGEKKCCRHKWMIDFKEIGTYDYIIQPRHFDAGYCDGSCPFRHNMGSNHAYFQSLAHHQLNKDKNIPNVCCAPTRLMDLEVLHIDEDDNTKLKVTTMRKMRAMKCSCT
jgi:hypothetical protein